MDEESVLFELGFTESPEARAKLDSMASAVEETQKRMSGTMEGVGDTAVGVVDKINKAAETAGEKAIKQVAEIQRSVISMPGGGASSATSAAEEAKKDAQQIIEAAKQQNAAAEELLAESEAKKTAIVKDALDVRTKEMQEYLERSQKILKGTSGDEVSTSGPGGQAKLFDIAGLNEYVSMLEKVELYLSGDSAEQWANKAGVSIDDLRERVAAFTEALTDPKKLEVAIESGEFIESTSEMARQLVDLKKGQAEFNDETARVAEIEEGYGRLVQVATQGGEALGKLSRGAALLGFAQGEASEETLQKLAKVQAAIDVFSGSAQALKAIKQGYNALKMILVGSTVSRVAEAKAIEKATESSEDHASALQEEIEKAKELEDQYRKTNAAREGKDAGESKEEGGATEAAKAVSEAIGIDGVGDLASMLEDPMQSVVDAAQGKVEGIVEKNMGTVADKMKGTLGKLFGAGGTGGSIAAGGAGGGGGGAAAAYASVGAVGTAALTAGIAGIASTAAAAFRDLTDDMTEKERRESKTFEETGTIEDVFMETGSALWASLKSTGEMFVGTAEEHKAAQDEANAAITEAGKAWIIGGMSIANMLPYVDLFGDKAAEAAEQASLAGQALFEALDDIAAMEVRANAELIQIRRQGAKAVFDTQMRAVRNDSEKEALLVAQQAELIAAIKEAGKDIGIDEQANQLNVNVSGASADEIAKLDTGLSALIELNDDLIAKTNQRISVTESMARAAKSAAMEEISSLQRVVKEKQSALKKNADALESSQVAFGKLSKGEQRRFANALANARKGEASKREIELIGKVRNDETEKLVNQYFTEKANDEGFAQLKFNLVPEKETAEGELDKAIADLAERANVAAETIRERLEAETREPLIFKIELERQIQEEVEDPAQRAKVLALEEIEKMQQQNAKLRGAQAQVGQGDDFGQRVKELSAKIREGRESEDPSVKCIANEARKELQSLEEQRRNRTSPIDLSADREAAMRDAAMRSPGTVDTQTLTEKPKPKTIEVVDKTEVNAVMAVNEERIAEQVVDSIEKSREGMEDRIIERINAENAKQEQANQQSRARQQSENAAG